MKYLFFSHDGKLGDAIIHTAFVDGVDKNDSAAVIHCTASQYSKDFWSLDKRIKKIISIDKPSWLEIIQTGLRLKKEKYDFVVSYEKIKSEKLKLFLFLLQPRITVVSRPIMNEHILEREEYVLAKIFNSKDKSSYALSGEFINHSIKRRYCLINLFAGINELKRSIKKYDALKLILRILKKNPHEHIMLICENHTEATALELVNCIKRKKNISIAHKNCTSGGIRCLIESIAEAKIIISPDTAIIHLASALNIPTVGIYQNDGQKSIQWAPRSDQTAIVLGNNTETIHGFSVKKVVSFYERFRQK